MLQNMHSDAVLLQKPQLLLRWVKKMHTAQEMPRQEPQSRYPRWNLSIHYHFISQKQEWVIHPPVAGLYSQLWPQPSLSVCFPYENNTCCTYCVMYGLYDTCVMRCVWSLQKVRAWDFNRSHSDQVITGANTTVSSFTKKCQQGL